MVSAMSSKLTGRVCLLPAEVKIVQSPAKLLLKVLFISDVVNRIDLAELILCLGTSTWQTV